MGASVPSLDSAMTVDQFRERLGRLQQEQEKARLAVTAYGGAIQECEYWLNVLLDEQKDEQEKEPVDAAQAVPGDRE